MSDKMSDITLRLRFLGVFVTGSVVASNLSKLLDINELYEAIWWKVGFAIVIFLFVTFMDKLQPKLKGK